jgi:hypothetical protein
MGPLASLGMFATKGAAVLGLRMHHGSLNSIYHKAEFEEAELPMIRFVTGAGTSTACRIQRVAGGGPLPTGGR